jgi:hypothetical protein
MRAGNADLRDMYLDSHVTYWTTDRPHRDAYTHMPYIKRTALLTRMIGRMRHRVLELSIP